MKAVSLILIISITFCSCSSTVQLSSLAEANRKVGNAPAELHMKSGQIFDGKHIRFESTSTWFAAQKNDSLMQVNTQDIDYIYFKHRAGGAIEGLLIGGAFGAGSLYTASSLANGSGGEARAARGWAFLGGFAFGGLVGLTVGILKGHEYKLILPQDSTYVR